MTAPTSPLDRDPQRPRYHFLPPANWLNDPNGVGQWQGQYHLFYQYNPEGAFHHRIHWGHALSSDLVHWQHLPVALTPTPDGPDADGCWSGCLVDDHGVPTLIYTGMRLEDGVKVQRTCLATSSDNLLTWNKHPTAIIEQVSSGLDVLGFRDHCVWRENDSWYQVIGSGIRDVGGAALLYRSADLRAWEYVQPVYVGDHTQHDPFWTGQVWECPDLFPLGDKHLLVVSVWSDAGLHYCVCYLGTFAEHSFTPERVSKLDAGPSFYAPQSMRDEQGRRLMWGWLREGRTPEVQRASGWSGVMSLPRLFELRPDGVLNMRPAPELQQLREQHQQLGELALDEAQTLLAMRGDTLELLVEFALGDADEVGISVRCADDGSEATHIRYNCVGQQLLLDTRQASSDETTVRGLYTVPCPLPPGEPLRLHIFLDRSVIEVFVNQMVVGALRVYPTGPASDGMRVFAHNGAARLTRLDVWTLRSIW